MKDCRYECFTLQKQFFEIRALIFRTIGVQSFANVTSGSKPLTPPQLCLNIASQYHYGQVDKSGAPYIGHPMAVASNFTDPNLQCIALLHDVIEDTPCNASQLIHLNVDKRIVKAVSALSRPSGLSYGDYLKRVVKDPWAVYVKLADLSHNMDLSRLSIYDEKVLKRCNRYVDAIKYIATTVWGCKI